MDYSIYALKVADEWREIVISSLQQGEGRFGWSYDEKADIRELRKRIEKDGWAKLSDDEKECYQGFLLDLEVNDYVVYINVPVWGKCTIAKVTGPYFWKWEGPGKPNHRFQVAAESVKTFDRNDAIVHPALSARLKLQGRFWRIYVMDEFEALIRSLQNDYSPSSRMPEDNLRSLSEMIQKPLLEITRNIQHTHPNYDLESLATEIFRNISGVRNVTKQGGAGDHGADIIVKYSSGIPIPGLETESTIIVQVKSFVGEHWDTKAVNDIRRAFNKYPDANMGLIISTAEQGTKALEDELDNLRDETQKPIALLIGPDVAKFLLRFGSELLRL